LIEYVRLFFAGMARDVFGDYDTLFYVSAAVSLYMMVGAIAALYIIRRRRSRRWKSALKLTVQPSREFP